ncbi:MAG: cytochrome C [Saprospiraceae bacterium]
MKKLLALLPLFLALSAFKMPVSMHRPAADPTIPADVQTLLDKYSCTSCHAMSRRLVGPMWTDVVAKGYSAKRITQLVKTPEPGNWPGYSPMAPLVVPKADMTKIANWLVSMKK